MGSVCQQIVHHNCDMQKAIYIHLDFLSNDREAEAKLQDDTFLHMEAAEMVAFMRESSGVQRCVASACLLCSTDTVFSHWLVSMCANDMFITTARCERPYLDDAEVERRYV